MDLASCNDVSACNVDVFALVQLSSEVRTLDPDEDSFSRGLLYGKNYSFQHTSYL